MANGRATYFNGIRDEKGLRDRSQVDPVTDCWRWTMCLCGGYPKLQIILPDGSKKRCYGRRAALIVKLGRDPGMGVVACATGECKYIDCVNPSHARAGTKSEALTAAGLRGAYSTPTRLARLNALSQAKRKVTIDQSREIAVSDESDASIAQQYGISRQYVKVIRDGGVGRRSAPTSVFEWRG